MKAQVAQMLVLQDNMNRKVHPTWFNQGFAWHRACWGEAAELFVHLFGNTVDHKWLITAELMEGFGWKWWKHQEVDANRVTLALQALVTDVQNFPGASEELDGLTPQDAVDKLAQALLANQDDTEEWLPIVVWLSKQENNGFGDVDLSQTANLPDVDPTLDGKIQAQIELVDIFHFILSMLLTRFDAEKAVDEIVMARNETAGLDPLSLFVSAPQIASAALSDGNVLHPFFRACDALDLSLDELHKRYVQKNVLNFFRQDNGYKDGSYIKMWHGKEDNEVLEELADQMDTGRESFPDDLYEALEIEYRAVKASA